MFNESVKLLDNAGVGGDPTLYFLMVQKRKNLWILPHLTWSLKSACIQVEIHPCSVCIRCICPTF